MVYKLAEVAGWLYNKTQTLPGMGTHQVTREFIRRYTVNAVNLNTGYYYNYTRVKNWDVLMFDLWKCIPDVSDPTQRNPEVLCFDATDLYIMILAAMGVDARSVRVIAGDPQTFGPGGQPQYLDHTMAETWTGTMWCAQDPFYNVEYIKPSGGTYDWASVDDLCMADDLSVYTPKNHRSVFTQGVSNQSGWVDTGAEPLRSQDFFAAVEHRDVGGALSTPVNGSPTIFANARSVAGLNHTRCDFTRGFYNPNTAQVTPLRTLVTGFTRQHRPVVIERP